MISKRTLYSNAGVYGLVIKPYTPPGVYRTYENTVHSRSVLSHVHIIISKLTVFELPPLDVMPGEKNYMWL